jgi:hypothetical protein
MARTVTIPLPDQLATRLEAEAKARGNQSIDRCIVELLSESLGQLPHVPADQKALEAELLKGLEGPSREMNAEDRERRKADLSAWEARRCAG